MSNNGTSCDGDTPATNVFFPQTCTHIAHDFNIKGELRTVLVTGGDRLVFLKDGVRVAESGPLLKGDLLLCGSHPITQTSINTPPAEFPRVKHISICPFSKDTIRVVMVTNNVACLFEVDDSDCIRQDSVLPLNKGMIPKESQTAPLQSLQWASHHGRFVGSGNPQSSSADASAPVLGPSPVVPNCASEFRVRVRRLGISDPTEELDPLRPLFDSPRDDGEAGLSANLCRSTPISNQRDARTVKLGFPRLSHEPYQMLVKRKTRRTTIVTAAFVTEHTICLVYDDEAILVSLSSSVCDFYEKTENATAMVADAQVRTVWRSMGAYTALAVCRFSNSVALSLQSSTIVVFPTNVKQYPIDSYDFPTVSMKKTPSTNKPPFVSLATTMNSLPNTLFTHGGKPTGRGSDLPTTSLPLNGTSTDRREDADVVADSLTILSEHGLTAFLGIYRIHCMEWHCVSTHTLLCVTCVHPRDGGMCVMLYTIHSLPTMPPFSNTLHQDEDISYRTSPSDDDQSGFDISRGLFPSVLHQSYILNNFVQLVPMGVIPFMHTHGIEHFLASSRLSEATSSGLKGSSALTWPGKRDASTIFVKYSVGQCNPSNLFPLGGHMTGRVPLRSKSSLVLRHTGLIPSFSCSSEDSSLSDTLQFLNVEADGTVWTSCYRSGIHRHSSSVMQRAQGLTCMNLLAPLFKLYGTLYRMDVLPMYKYRPLEMGPVTPHSKLPMNGARRYRFVGHFDMSGIVAVIMLDLSVSTYRVECFLAAGSRPILSLCTLAQPFVACRGFGEEDRLVAALLADTDNLPDGASLAGSGDSGQPHYTGRGGGVRSIAESRTDDVHGCWGIAIFSQRWTFRGFASTLLMVAPFTSLQNHQAMSLNSTQSRGSSPQAPEPKSETFPPVNDLELGLKAGMGARHSMQRKYSDRRLISPALPEPLKIDEVQLFNQQQKQYDVHPDAGNFILPSELKGQSPCKFGSPKINSNLTSDAMSQDTPCKDPQYVLRGGCVMPDGECLYLSASYDLCYTGEMATTTYPDHTQSFSPCSDVVSRTRTTPAGFLILLPPAELESPDLTHSNILVGGACIVRAGPATFIPIQNPFFHLQELVGDPSNDGVGELKQAEGMLGGGVDPLTSRLRRIISYLHEIKDSAKEVQCEVVAQSSRTEEGVSTPAWGVRVRSPALPSQWVQLPIEHERCMTITHIIDLQGQLVMNDTVIGVLVRKCRSPLLEPIQGQESSLSPGKLMRGFEACDIDDTELLLYGIPAMQPDRGGDDPVFDLEAIITNVDSFFMGPRGEVLVKHRHRLSRWLRSFPSFQSNDGRVTGHCYSYVEDVQHRLEWFQPSFPVSLAVHSSVVPSAPHLSTVASCSVENLNKPNGGDGGNFLAMTYITEPTTKMGDNTADSEQSEQRSRVSPRTHLICSFSDTDYLRMLPTPFASEAASFEDSVRPVPQYHPESVMQLIGMERWRALGAILGAVAKAARACVVAKDRAALGHELSVRGSSESSTPCMACGGAGRVPLAPTPGVVRGLFPTAIQAATLAHELCTPRHYGSHRGRDPWTFCAPRPVALDVACEEEAAGGTPSVMTSLAACHFFDTAMNDDLIQDLRVLLPKVSLHGLSSRAQLDLVCIVEALGAARRFGISLDEAASRFYFFFKLNELRGRLQPVGLSPATTGPEGGVTILQFATDHTAARVVVTMSYLWAAMSDSQALILRELLPGLPIDLSYKFSGALISGAAGEVFLPSPKAITWEFLERCGVAYWLKDPSQLRVLADAVAREQFRATKSIPDCALMYCISGNVSTLVALCKERKENRLRDFYSRDFSEGANRRAAVANAYAALGKNLISYAASFFLLAGDLRSAVQIILQRQQNPSLALFVLRSSVISQRDNSGAAKVATTHAEDLQWFLQVLRAESCGVQMDLWLQGCLYWVMGGQEGKVTALQCLARHPTGHPEVLCVLRHARKRVAELSQRERDFLLFECELLCLLRLGRYCQVHRLDLNAQLHYADVQRLLKGYSTEMVLMPRRNPTGAWTEFSSSQLIEKRPRTSAKKSRLQSDYNTGTLMFEGFGNRASDDDEDESVSTEADSHTLVGEHWSERKVSVSTNTIGPASTAIDALRGPVLGISKRFVDMIEAEIAYATLILRGAPCTEHCPRAYSPQTDRDRGSLAHPMCTSTVLSITDTGLYNVLYPLLLSVMRESPSAEIERCLTNLLTYLLPDLVQVAWSPPLPILSSPPHSDISQTSQFASPFPRNPTHVVLMMVLFLSLSEVATRSQNQPLACVLVRVSCYSLNDLERGATFVGLPAATRVHPVVAFWSCLHYHLAEFCFDNHRDSHVTSGPDDTVVGSEAVDHATARSGDSDLDGGGSLPVTSSEYEAFYQTLFAAASNEKCIPMTSQGSSTATTPDPERQLFAREVDLIDWHFAWSSCYVSAHVLQVLWSISEYGAEMANPQSPTTQLGVRAEISHSFREGTPRSKGASYEAESFETQHSFRIWVLLCCCMAYATLHFDRLAADCYTCLQRFHLSYNDDRQTAPNGVLVEVRHALSRTLAALCAFLEVVSASRCRAVPTFAFKADSASGCYEGDITQEKVGAEEGLKEENATESTFADFSSLHPPLLGVPSTNIAAFLVRLCAAHAELFLGLPSVGQAETLEHLRRRPVQTFSLLPGSEIGVMTGCGGRTCGQGGVSVSRNPIFRIFDAPAGEHGCEGGEGCDGGYGWELDRRGRAVLQRMELYWQRLHHTYRSFRNQLLTISTKGILSDDPLVTERLLLNHSSHSIRCLDFDYSSCESLVWATEAGLFVSHGFRELLASDNEDALKTQALERNMATAAFSRGFEAQLRLLDMLNSKGGSLATTPSSAAMTLAGRPRAAIAVSMCLVSHPHLPFFLSNHPDGHLDLYPFASPECIASYLCPGGCCATTPVSFSTNGWQFTVGLQDGSIVGWRFATVDADKALMFCLPSWFLPSGVRAVFFCGEQTSRVVAVGSVLEPHRTNPVFRGVSGDGDYIIRSHDSRPQAPAGATHQESRDPFTATATWLPSDEDSITESAHLDASLQESVMRASLTSASSIPTGRNRHPHPVTVQVSEILVIDTALKVGEVVVRCALPFTAEFAVYLNSLDVVLVVSVEGFIAAYEVHLGRLTLLNDMPLAEMIQGRRLGGSRSSEAHLSDLIDSASTEMITAIAVSPYDPILALGTSSGFALLLRVNTVAETIRCRNTGGKPHSNIAKQWTFTYFHPHRTHISQHGHNRAVNRVHSLPSRVEPPDRIGRLVYYYEPTNHHGGCLADYVLKAESVGSDGELAVDAPEGESTRCLPLLQHATRVQMAPLQGRPNSSVLDLKFAPSVLLAGLKDGSLMAARLIPESLRRFFLHRVPSKVDV
ncbi:unnamed protein product [Phytomonas sp. EM1]|nr:unnamed protein product [Phytomonas sp. EM1]|eukprot:CCW64546.1 unnamed protein product [Phytomonas sp. isolate EM1]